MLSRQSFNNFDFKWCRFVWMQFLMDVAVDAKEVEVGFGTNGDDISNEIELGAKLMLGCCNF